MLEKVPPFTIIQIELKLIYHTKIKYMHFSEFFKIICGGFSRLTVRVCVLIIVDAGITM